MAKLEDNLSNYDRQLIASYLQDEEKDKTPQERGLVPPAMVRPVSTEKTTGLNDADRQTVADFYAQQDQVPEPKGEQNDFTAGLKQFVDQSQATAYGLGALGADLVGADDARDSMLEGYQRNMEESAQYDREYYNVDYLTSKDASVGDWVDAAQYFAGKAVGNVGEFAIGGGVAGAIAKSVAKRQIKKTIAKQIEGGTRKAAREKAIDRVAEDAAKRVGKSVSIGVIGGLAGKEGLGSTYGSAVEEQLRRGNTVDDVNLGKVVGYGTLAAGAEFAGDLLLGAASKAVPGGSSEALQSVLAGGNILARVGKGAAASAITEAPTEMLQTTFETLGSDQELGTDNYYAALRQSAFAGAFQGGITGGALNTLNTQKPQTPETKEQTNMRWAALAAQRQRDAVLAAAEGRAPIDDDVQNAIDARFGLESVEVQSDAELNAASKKAAKAAKKEHDRIQNEYDAMFNEKSGTVVSDIDGTERPLTLGELVNLQYGDAQIDGEVEATAPSEGVDYQDIVNRLTGVTREASTSTKRGITEALAEPSGEFGLDPVTQEEYELTVGEALDRRAGIPREVETVVPETEVTKQNDLDYVSIINSVTGVNRSGVKTNSKAVDSAFAEPSGVFTVDPDTQMERELNVGELLRRNAAYELANRTGEDVRDLLPSYVQRVDSQGNVTYVKVGYGTGAMGAITSELTAGVAEVAKYDSMFDNELKDQLGESDINKKTGQPNASAQKRLASMRLMTTDKLRAYAARHEGKWFGDAASIILTERLQAMQALVYGDQDEQVDAPEIVVSDDGAVDLAANPQQLTEEQELGLDGAADIRADNMLEGAANQVAVDAQTAEVIDNANAAIEKAAVRPNIDALLKILQPILDDLTGNQRKLADFILAREADGTLSEFYDLTTGAGRQSALSTGLIGREMGMQKSSVDSALKGMRAKMEATGLDPKRALAMTARTEGDAGANMTTDDAVAGDLVQEESSMSDTLDEAEDALDVGDFATGSMQVRSNPNDTLDAEPIDGPRTRKKTVSNRALDDQQRREVEAINAERNRQLDALYETAGGRVLINAYNSIAQRQGLPEYTALPMGLKLELVEVLGNATFFKQDGDYSPLGRAVSQLPAHLSRVAKVVKQDMAEVAKDADQTKVAAQPVDARDDGQQGSVPEVRPVESEVGRAPVAEGEGQGRQGRKKITLKREEPTSQSARIVSAQDEAAANNADSIYTEAELMAQIILDGGDFNAAVDYMDFLQENAEVLGLDAKFAAALGARLKELGSLDGTTLEVLLHQTPEDFAAAANIHGVAGAPPRGWATRSTTVNADGSVNQVLYVGLTAYKAMRNDANVGIDPVTVMHELHHAATIGTIQAARAGLLGESARQAVMSLTKSSAEVVAIINSASDQQLLDLAAAQDFLEFGVDAQLDPNSATYAEDLKAVYESEGAYKVRSGLAQLFVNEFELVTQVLTDPRAAVLIHRLSTLPNAEAKKSRGLLRRIIDAISARLFGRQPTAESRSTVLTNVFHANSVVMGTDISQVGDALKRYAQLRTLVDEDPAMMGEVIDKLMDPKYAAQLAELGIDPMSVAGSIFVADSIVGDKLEDRVRSIVTSMSINTAPTTNRKLIERARAAYNDSGSVGDMAEAVAARSGELLSVGTLKSMTLRQIAQRSKSAAVRKYIQVTQAITRTAKERIGDAHTMNMKWVKLQKAYATEERDMSGLMVNSTLAGFDPTSGKPTTALEQQLLDVYNNLPKPLQELYVEVRDYYKEDFDTKVDLFERAMLEAQAKGSDVKSLRADMQRMKAVKGPYFPLKRLDKYFAVGRSQALDDLITRHEETPLVGDDLAAMREMRLDPKHYVVESFPSLAQAKRRSNELGDSMGVGYSSVGRDMFARESKSLPDIDQMMQYFGADGAYDTAGLNNIRATLAYMYADMLPEKAGMKSQMKREGVSGASADMRRVFANVAVGNAHRIASLDHASELGDAVKDLRKLQRSRDLEDQYVANEIISRSNTALEFAESPVVDSLLSFSYFANLGLSPAYIFTNMTQVPMITAPWLYARFGSAKSATALFDAYGVATKILKTNLTDQGWRAEFDWKGTFPEGSGTDRMLTELLNSNLIDITIEQDLSAVSKGTSAGFGRGGDTMQFLNTPVRVTELANRAVTAIATYNLALASDKLKGMSPEEQHLAATEQASQAVAETQLDYSGLNAPSMMNSILGSRSLGKLAFQFRKYQQGMLYLLLSNMKDSVKGESPEVRSIARKTILGLFVTTSLTAGVTGVPFVGSVAFIANAIANAFGDDDDPLDVELELRNYIYDMTGDAKITAAVMDGLPNLADVDLSKRIGMGAIASPLPFMREQQSTRAQAGEALVNIGGAGVSYGLNAYDGLKMVLEGDWDKGLEKLLPVKGAQNVLRAYRYGVEGMTDSKGNTIKDDEAFSGYDLFVRGLGFSTTQESTYYKANKALMDKKTAVEDTKAALTQRYVLAKEGGDMEELSEVRADIAAFNQRNPKVRLKTSSLNRSYRNRRKTQRRGDSGVKSGKAYRPYEDEARFAGDN